MSTLIVPNIKDSGILGQSSADEPTTSVRRTSQGPSKDAWCCLRPIIRKLYVDEERTLTDVMSIMAEIYGHKAR